jgi:hypothetical protein
MLSLAARVGGQLKLCSRNSLLRRAMSMFNAFERMRRSTGWTLALAALVSAIGCNLLNSGRQPSVEISLVPHAGPGGPERTEPIGGKVTGSKPGQKIVLYAQSGVWWVQPTVTHPFTEIQPDSTWKSTTHLGSNYAALLVDAQFEPATRIASLPTVGRDVFAVVISPGRPGLPANSKTIHFSGYDWNVRTTSSDRGGAPNAYDPANIWTDKQGYLHLVMETRNGRWTCAEVNLDRSLGFGTYRFVVQDVVHLPPSAVLALFTWDDIRSEEFRNELDIELSRWGDPQGRNAQYVVQPFYVPENVSRFLAPPGVLTHELRWEPGAVTFNTRRGARNDASAHLISEHTFNSGIPKPASETVHISLYDSHRTRQAAEPPIEVVIESFEYEPRQTHMSGRRLTLAGGRSGGLMLHQANSRVGSSKDNLAVP